MSRIVAVAIIILAVASCSSARAQDPGKADAPGHAEPNREYSGNAQLIDARNQEIRRNGVRLARLSNRLRSILESRGAAASAPASPPPQPARVTYRTVAQQRMRLQQQRTILRGQQDLIRQLESRIASLGGQP